MNWKEEYIERYGQAAYEKRLEQKRQWREANPEKLKEMHRQWNEANPEKVKMNSNNQDRKGGSRYEKKLRYKRTGLQGARNKMRAKHQYMWGEYKKIIAPGSQIHHEWIPETPNYKGVAIVETDQHMQGIIKVIQILKGVITVFTEKEIREQAREHGIK